LEKALVMPLFNDQLCGIHHSVEQPAETGVLLAVGGPQTRVGSHRQFVLLARALANKGIPVLRFDYRGMGDSSGDQRSFEQVDEDIAVAIDRFFDETPGLKKVVIWGLCDAASAALFYAHKDERVQGMVLLNPWARTESGAAKAYLKHYYLQRITSADFWKKVLGGRFDLQQSLSSLLGMIKKTLGKGSSEDNSSPVVVQSVEPGEVYRAEAVDKSLQNKSSFIQRMRDGFEQFEYPILLIISGNDLTSSEFLDNVAADYRWRRLLKRKQVSQKKLESADHTFSTRVWRDQVANWTCDWVLKLNAFEELL
jgi:exosortase A-associated hydrolase 1